MPDTSKVQSKLKSNPNYQPPRRRRVLTPSGHPPIKDRRGSSGQDYEVRSILTKTK